LRIKMGWYLTLPENIRLLLIATNSLAYYTKA
jgi:hypothetical protein